MPLEPDGYFGSIAQTSLLLKAGDVSPVELLEALLERIGRLDPQLHSFITVTAETAREEARAAEREIAAGGWRGPLHGIPVAYKDNIATRGIRTTAHSKSLADWVPDADATVVARLKAAGAVCIGKNALHELAFGSPGDNAAFPAALNPWSLAHSPGVSSSGSGASVAAGLAFASLGTDTGGSIRHPASVCGIVGMKPTYGRVSNHGVIPLAPTMDHVGPLTRTVLDNAIVLAAIAGPDEADPPTVNQPQLDAVALYGQPIAGLRLGVPRKWIDAAVTDEDVLGSFRAALDVLTGLGAQIRTIDIPDIGNAVNVGYDIIVYEAYRYFAQRIADAPEKYDGPFLARMQDGSRITAEQHAQNETIRAALRRAFANVFATGIDLVVTPGREGPAATMEALRAGALGKRGALTRVFDMTGMPALVLPMGFNTDDLPLGLQIAGPWWREDRIYQVAAAYEAATAWHHERPSTA